MFFGEYTHSLDGKGRVILPAKYRGRLADGAIATSAVDGCLAVWAPEDFLGEIIRPFHNPSTVERPTTGLTPHAGPLPFEGRGSDARRKVRLLGDLYRNLDAVAYEPGDQYPFARR